MSSYNVVTSDFLNLSITNSGQESCYAERRFQKGITVNEFKVRYPLPYLKSVYINIKIFNTNYRGNWSFLREGIQLQCQLRFMTRMANLFANWRKDNVFWDHIQLMMA